jgi:transketolase
VNDLDRKCINTIRTLAIDAVEEANSGHPGLPMGAAPMAYVLWTKFLRFDPKNPIWVNRDRFILSAGHGSMLLYSLLHLTGYDLSLDELKRFRSLNSKTPGHPEYGHTPGVETTTGPLGQGFANGVGMAIAEKHLGTYFNRPGYKMFDYRIFGIVSDGDLMEGVSAEAASLAGHLKLDNIIYLYDDNSITIDGPTSLSFSEDVGARFKAYGWYVKEADGNDLGSIENALEACIKQTRKPSLIRVKTNIGYGSPNKQDTADVHGSPLGEQETRLTKVAYGWDPEKKFYIPEEALSHFRQVGDKGRVIENQWNTMFKAYKDKHPTLYGNLEIFMMKDRPVNWENVIPAYTAADGKIATRKASGTVLDKLTQEHPYMIGGSADLTPSNNTKPRNAQQFTADNRLGRYINYGVREHAMGAVMNGLALSRFRPYGGTFLIFSDYMRASVRLAALMGIPVIYVYTHDSIGLGEDGPTHQPVEHLAALRAIPNLTVIRPADAIETAYAWKMALERKSGPTVLALTRQGLPVLDRTRYAPASEIEKGGYILAGHSDPQIIIIATGSEVQLALAAYEQLSRENIPARVVNMASWEVFEEQEEEYKAEVLQPNITRRLSVEAGVSFGWTKYVGTDGKSISVERYGASAPVAEVMKEFGFTVENVVSHAKRMLRLKPAPKAG